MKKLAAGLASLLLALSLSACATGSSTDGQSGSSGSGSQATPTAQGQTQGQTQGQGQGQAQTTTEPAGDPQVKRVDTDTLTWEFDESTATLYIHGSGPMRDYDYDYPEWYDCLCEQAQKVVIDDGITRIGAYAFADGLLLHEVYLPDSVEIIAESAFDYCWDIWTITIPANLKYIGRRAFYNCIIHEPQTFAFPEGCTTICEEAFHAALIETDVYIPASLTYLGHEPFSNSAIKSITVAEDNPCFVSIEGALLTKDLSRYIQYPNNYDHVDYSIPEGTKSIESGSLNVAQNIQTLTIPASVTHIDEGSIFTNYQLVSIIVDPQNPAYKSVDGILYTKDGKVLLAYPEGKHADSLVIPEGVERIGDFVFYTSFDLTSIELPSTLKSIGEEAFSGLRIQSVSLPAGFQELDEFALYWCEELTVIELNEGLKTIPYCCFGYSGVQIIRIPTTVTHIDQYAFEGCDSLTTVYYAGTQEQWDRIVIDEGNEPLLAASVFVGV